MEAPADPPKKPLLDPAVVDDLAARTRKFLGEVARDYVKRPVEGLLRWVLGRAVAYLLAAALFITAAVFLLVGGVHGLREAGVPAWIAYLALGVVAILAGLILLRSSRADPKS